MSDRSFPAGFLWGTATASYQVEGAATEGGRGQSIWDTFSHTPGRTVNGDNGDVSCRHYELVAEDLQLMRRLGLHAYRFSVAWPRVQPDGKGGPNATGLDFYRRLVAGLRQQGMVPVATLYHWDLPQALEDAGGWTARDTAERFADYASLVADALADDVGLWTTLNEPWVAAWLGYGVGIHAPGRKEPDMAALAVHHLLLGHARATEVLRAKTKNPVGITLNSTPMVPASDHPLDVSAAESADASQNRLFLDPLFKGQYPDGVRPASAHGPVPGAIEAGDLAAISQPVDFLGVNYYSTNVVADASRLLQARAGGLSIAPRQLRRAVGPWRRGGGPPRPGAAVFRLGGRPQGADGCPRTGAQRVHHCSSVRDGERGR